MEDNTIERIITNAIGIGTIQTLKEFGLWEEHISERQAYKLYGEKNVKEWRHKRWILGYPSGNAKIKKTLFKRSELEIASRMMDIQNIIPENKINNRIAR